MTELYDPNASQPNDSSPSTPTEAQSPSDSPESTPTSTPSLTEAAPETPSGPTIVDQPGQNPLGIAPYTTPTEPLQSTTAGDYVKSEAPRNLSTTMKIALNPDLQTEHTGRSETLSTDIVAGIGTNPALVPVDTWTPPNQRDPASLLSPESAPDYHKMAVAVDPLLKTSGDDTNAGAWTEDNDGITLT